MQATIVEEMAIGLPGGITRTTQCQSRRERWHAQSRGCDFTKGNEKNREKGKIGLVQELIPGRDGAVRGVRLRAGKSFLERAI